MRMIMIAWIVAAFMACAPEADFENATLTEGVGIEPGLVLAKSSLSEVREFLGDSAGEVHTSGGTFRIETGPLRLEFAAPQGGGEPVLGSITTSHIPNPSYPQFRGSTGGGIRLLDSTAKMREVYGEPATEQISSFNRIYYYTSGVIFAAQHPSQISGFHGPEATPEGLHITSIMVTAPFEILEEPDRVRTGQRELTTAPRTTLRVPSL